MPDALQTLGPEDSYTETADRFGARPLYVASPGSIVVRAGSQRALKLAGAADGIDFLHVRDDLLGHFGRSFLRNVRRVPPGATLQVEAGNVRVRPAGLLVGEDTSHIKRRGQLTNLLLDRLGDALDEALGDEPPAIALSGGLDSAALLVLACEHAPVCWTLVNGPMDPAFMRSRHLAQENKVTFNLVETREAMLPDRFEDAVRASESLIFNARAVAHYILFETIAESGATQVISGVGADELLMGHPGRITAGEAKPAPLQALHLADQRIMRKLLADEFHVGEPGPIQPLDRAGVREIALTRILPHLTLPVVSRAAATFGQELILPFLAPQVVSLGLGLGHADLIDDDTSMGKTLLREAVEGLVPNKLRGGSKRARLSPAGGGSAEAHTRWTQVYDGLLSDGRLAELPLLNGAGVRKLLARYASQTEYNSPGFVVMDRILMRLASLSVLQRHLG